MVFAYHDVGVRCLRTLLAHGVEVPLVFTHADAPGEKIWFDSVARHARWHGIEVLTPEDPNVPDVIERGPRARSPISCSRSITARCSAPSCCRCRRAAPTTCTARCCRKYRGRVPVNWAVLHGERETGATLHAMVAKPDAGDIVDSEAVPILPDDTALEVFRKVTVAAEVALHRCLPALIAGTARARAAGSGRRQLFRPPHARATAPSTGGAVRAPRTI